MTLHGRSKITHAKYYKYIDMLKFRRHPIRKLAMNAIFQSKRFWLTVASVIVVALKDVIPVELTADQVTQIVLAIGAWIVGDSLRATNPNERKGTYR
jgi:hypothetical protein